MTDISGCFDRIVAPVISILNLKNGCPTAAADMHATTLQNAKYHLKTKMGVSDDFYSHSKTIPVYGNGQGAGDSPSQWCQQSAMLFNLYIQCLEGTTMSDHWGEPLVNLPMAAFADDTNLFKSYCTGHVPASTWMTHPPCSWYPGSSSTYSVSDNLTLFYIDHRLIVVYIILVDI
jgi:hypothetical protein